MNRGSVAHWLSTPLTNRARLAPADVAFALVLSAFAVASAAGLEGSNAHSANAGGPAALVVLLMNAPVLVARRWPVSVCAVLAAGAGLNWVVIGHLVRCGAGLVAVFYTAFVLGARCRTTATAVGIALLAVNIVCQAYSDPQLGSGVIVYMVPIALAFAAAGRLLGSRNAIVAELRASTGELRVQRDENARLAVTTEQARVAGRLDGFLSERVDRISEVAATGRASLTTSPQRARGAFEEISRSGREALTRMRDVVADLENGSPEAGGIEPAPMLAQLDRLLANAVEGSAQFRVLGDPRLLPPGLELSAYRIVERMLEAIDSDAVTGTSPGPVEVVVEFGPHELQLTVAGTIARRRDVRAALAAAAERAAVHGGRLQTSTTDRRRTTVVALPLVTGHV